MLKFSDDKFAVQTPFFIFLMKKYKYVGNHIIPMKFHEKKISSPEIITIKSLIMTFHFGSRTIHF